MRSSLPTRMPVSLVSFLTGIVLAGMRKQFSFTFPDGQGCWTCSNIYWLKRILKQHSKVSLLLRAVTQFLSPFTDCSSDVWFPKFFTHPEYWPLSDGEGHLCRSPLHSGDPFFVDPGFIFYAAGACGRRHWPGPILTVSPKSFKCSGSTLRCLISFELILA